MPSWLIFNPPTKFDDSFMYNIGSVKLYWVNKINKKVIKLISKVLILYVHLHIIVESLLYYRTRLTKIISIIYKNFYKFLKIASQNINK